MSSIFESILESPPDKVFGVAQKFIQDPSDIKVDLTVGAYRCDQGKPYVFPTVRRVEEELVKKKVCKEYLPIDGFFTLKKATQKLIFGSNCSAIEDGSIASVQSLSGTGALRLAGDFIKKLLPSFKHIFFSNPTWPNHQNIFETIGFNIGTYGYWNSNSLDIDFEKMCDDLESISQPSIILLHSSGHNPTGTDLSMEQWEKVAEILKRKKHVPLFDIAYQGYVSGDFAVDAGPVRLFQKKSFEMFVCQSFAKNMGLYGERMGMLHVVCKSKQLAEIVVSNLKTVIRSEYSSPPNWGSRILDSILNTPEYEAAWKKELKCVAERLISIRKELYDGLVRKETPGTWEHLSRQKGMFSYTGLTSEQCAYLEKRWRVYMLSSGRISIAGLNSSNVTYVVDAIDDAIRKVKA